MYRRKYYLPILFISSTILIVFAAWAKLTHARFAGNAMILALVSYGSLVLLMINKVLSSAVLNSTEKLWWVVIFILGGYLGMALYFLSAERQVKLIKDREPSR